MSKGSKTVCRHAVAAAAIIAAAFLGGCRSNQPSGPMVFAPTDGELRPASLEYATLARTHNARVAQLDRLWGRAHVRMAWIDEEGDRQEDGGEGHLQWRRPAMALSLGKLGEPFVWIGMDASRFWLLSRRDDVAQVGTHASITLDEASRLGLPVPPAELPPMMGLAALPEPGTRNEPTVHEDPASGRIGVQLPRREGGYWQLEFDPERLHLVRVAMVSEDGFELLTSDLTDYERIRPRGGEETEVPTRVLVLDPRSGAELSLSLGSVDDGWAGRRNKLPDAAFDFESLVELQGPFEVVDLDAPAG
ncbi:MAG: hypothetical protein AAGI30_05615 [Planctomycetota bacterium]